MTRDSNPTSEIRITGEGWVYLIILGFISVGAVLRNVNLLILLSGMMIAPLLINWRFGVLWSRNLTARRSVPHRTHARQFSSLQWIFINRAPLTAWSVEIFDSLVPFKRDPARPDDTKVLTGSSEEDEPNQNVWQRLRFAILNSLGSGLRFNPAYNVRLEVPKISGHQQEAASCRLHFGRRGAYRVGPAMLLTRFPFGLILTRVRLDSDEVFYVAPAVGKLTPVWDRRLRSILAGSDAVLKRRSAVGEDFYGLRNWRFGDGRKLIHWRTSAKYGSPIVKQFEQPDHRDFAILLDLYAPAHSVTDLDPHAELCEAVLSFATTVIIKMGAAIQGSVALAICGSRTTILQSRSQRDIFDEAMRQMAVVHSSPAPEWESSILKLANSVSSDTPIIVISTRPQPADLIFASRQPTAYSTTDADVESQHRRRLQALSSSIVWISADSPEFEEMFSREFEDGQELKTLAEKWNAEVKV